MSELWQHPLWKPEDLGRPVPPVRHGVSVCLPTWDAIIGYEEKDPAVIERMEAGYPRFFFHPLVAEAHEEALRQFGGEGEVALVYPHFAAAERCLDYMKGRVGLVGRAVAWNEFWVVLVSQVGFESARQYWRFAGEGISSRQAVRLLGKSDELGEDEISPLEGEEARRAMRVDLARRSGQREEDVFLFPSGMAAIAAVHRVLMERSPEGRSLQLEFPYVDALKVQENLGAGAEFLSGRGKSLPQDLPALLERETLAGVYTEVPSNPMLRTADLEALASLLRESDVPLLVDDTVASVGNVDVFRFADVATTSLTKIYSGVGDVMAGAVILRSDSAFREIFREALSREPENALGREDAVVLRRNSLDFDHRLAETNANGERLAALLKAHPAVARVWYPKDSETAAAYEALRRTDGGYGGLMSFEMRGGEAAARRFYDRLRCCKGPSLGTDFTLVCPYVMLAHYDELEWAAELGVPSHLLRAWAGREPWEDLAPRFEEALADLA